MAQVTIKLDETEEKIVNVLKALKGYKSKEKVIKDIINEYGTRIELKEMLEKIRGK